MHIHIFPRCTEIVLLFDWTLHRHRRRNLRCDLLREIFVRRKHKHAHVPWQDWAMTKRLSGMRKTFLYTRVAPQFCEKPVPSFHSTFSFYSFIIIFIICCPICAFLRASECVCVCLRVSFNVFALRMKKSGWIECERKRYYSRRNLCPLCWIVGIGAATKIIHGIKKKVILWRKPPFFRLSVRVLPRYQ